MTRIISPLVLGWMKQLWRAGKHAGGVEEDSGLLPGVEDLGTQDRHWEGSPGAELHPGTCPQKGTREAWIPSAEGPPLVALN